MESIYEEYALVESQISALESKKEQLRPFIIKRMMEEKVEKIDTGMGKFSITKLKKWVYPDEVVELGDEFKAAKAKAESTGEATFTESESLRFTAVKL